jgi:UDP-N-acetyl-2-amino-2-deoxyglucuronate dehydrogenase
LILERAEVDWFLSVDRNDLPSDSKSKSLRELVIDGDRIEFSDGFTDLHTKVYEDILIGNGLGISDARPSIELVYKLRS